MTDVEHVEWDDVQGLILSGYGRLPYAAYVVWRFRPDARNAAKRWLRGLAERLMRAGSPKTAKHVAANARLTFPNIRALKTNTGADLRAINVALTARGLGKLGVGQSRLQGFSPEFLEGMAPKPNGERLSRRSNLLGDTDASSPEIWQWGGWRAGCEADGLLLLYAASEAALNALIEMELEAMMDAAQVCRSAFGDPVILKARVYDDRKEHFGFTDGISQPMIDGSPVARRSKDRLKQTNPVQADDEGKVLSAREQRISLVKPGEFVLGYLNERRERVVGAVVDKKDRGSDLLRNGTYLVFRQLEQDVDAFDGFVARLAQSMHGTTDEATKNEVAARLIGRRKSGEPLISAGADSADKPDRNDFLYAYEDGAGIACPIGAHIRRANPRDTIGPDPDTALRLSKMHRIIRRGRPYGPRRGDAGASGKDVSRGIAFIALNADIAGQFEMIQHSWLNNPHFGGLYGGTDPIGHVACKGDEFAVQQRPVNLHVGKPRPFVTVRGGAYFFLPGINAVRALADG
jgi:Dyp-type peroxidase family